PTSGLPTCVPRPHGTNEVDPTRTNMDKVWSKTPTELTCSIQLEDNMREVHGSGHRRPSTTSLSRYRSCPELASATCQQDSPACDMAPMTDQDGILMHTTPVVRNSLCVDLPEIEVNNFRSAAATPSPPSTPGSQRKDVMTTSFNSHSTARRKLDSAGVIIGHSLPDDLPLKEENLRRLEELRVQGVYKNRPFEEVTDSERQWQAEADDESSLCTYSRYHTQGLSNVQNVDKCTQWLQSIQLNSTDKIKSRSQIQLTPI
ncbi:CAunnamed protein product, partial [Biomphalaria glabrata]